MDQHSWATESAARIGERVAYYRGRVKISAQELADRCAGLGMPSISRVVITKLENGRRETVSTAELQVLASALGVPPVLLLFPLGQQEQAEVLPGRFEDPLDAMAWFAGESLLGDPAPYHIVRQSGAHEPRGDDELFREHRNMAAELIKTLGRESRRQADIAAGTHVPRYIEAEGDPPPTQTIPFGSGKSHIQFRAKEDTPDLDRAELLRREDAEFQQAAGIQTQILRSCRARIRALGLEPPALPAGLQFVEEGGPYGAR